MKTKVINKCPHYDEHWGCEISPAKACLNCANAKWELEEKPNDDGLSEFAQMEKNKNNMKKLWIARDCDQYNDWDEKEPGNLTIFYDTPVLEHFSRGDMWCSARQLATIPTYMFPEIKPGECRVFVESE